MPNDPKSSAPHLRIAMIAGEESGDQLGASLMRDLLAQRPDWTFVGVGGARMSALGLDSLFPMARISLNGLAAIVKKLPMLIKLIRKTADQIAALEPDLLIIIDAPDFTHRVARRLRKVRPDIPVINYVPPTVWAIRQGRARKMRAYVDLSLALLPFEPEAHERLGGPPCVYVGHPVTAILAEKQRPPTDVGAERHLLVLPGSRHGEISRHMEPFGEAVRLLDPLPDTVTIPAVPHLVDDIKKAAALWPVRPEVITGEDAKWAAFSRATAALAASGTVTLELAQMRVPHIVGYQMEWLMKVCLPLLKVDSVAMSNLIYGEQVMPEFIGWPCTPENLARALQPLLDNTAERDKQLRAFDRIAERLLVNGAVRDIAAETVLSFMEERQKKTAAQ